MATYVRTIPTLSQQIRDCQIVVVLREATLEAAVEDHEAHEPRQVGTFRVTPVEVLKGDVQGELTLHVPSQGSAEQTEWQLAPQGAEPRVAFLVRDSVDTWVPYFSSMFPLDGETVLLSEAVEDDRPGHETSLDLAGLRTLIRQEAEERREREAQLREAEPEITTRREPYPIEEAPDAPDPGGSPSAPTPRPDDDTGAPGGP
ncbi:hypothetical protein ACFQ7F_24975 [Streptomyces sp. NPDC056486]|uniref:hypothetical protein n=1 Tax=Streptomyces sp. NPDC056486 TaxID=3345835 RepID=UPI00367ED368